MVGAPRKTTILLAASIAVVLLVALLQAPHAGAAQCTGASTSGYKLKGKQARKATRCLINKERAARGISRLKQQKSHRKAAKKHTRVMISKRCFNHLCPGEQPLAGRLTSADYLPCGCAWGIAENIAYGYRGKSSPRSTVKTWMSSSGHRANLLNRAFEHIGIGVAKGSPMGGGNAATYTATLGYRR